MESISPFASFTQGVNYSPPWQDLSIIGIAGCSGSGKTSVAMEIVKSLNLPWVVILSLVCYTLYPKLQQQRYAYLGEDRIADIYLKDSFYKSLNPEEHRLAHANQYDFDCPDAFDFDALVETLQDLKKG